MICSLAKLRFCIIYTPDSIRIYYFSRSCNAHFFFFSFFFKGCQWPIIRMVLKIHTLLIPAVLLRRQCHFCAQAQHQPSADVKRLERQYKTLPLSVSYLCLHGHLGELKEKTFHLPLGFVEHPRDFLLKCKGQYILHLLSHTWNELQTTAK